MKAKRSEGEEKTLAVAHWEAMTSNVDALFRYIRRYAFTKGQCFHLD